MELFATYLFIAVIAIIIIYYFLNKRRGVTLVKSTTDGEMYFVRDLPDKVDAANRLAYIRGELTRLINIIKSKPPEYFFNKYVKNDSGLNMSITEFTSCLEQLKRKYRGTPETFSESTPDAKYTSYSVNKGEQMVVCLRQKEDDSFVDNNTILFVILHELAHIMTRSIGHTEEFWTNFKFLLKEAEQFNLYKKEDYNSKSKRYCGMDITDNPLNDKDI